MNIYDIYLYIIYVNIYDIYVYINSIHFLNYIYVVDLIKEELCQLT